LAARDLPVTIGFDNNRTSSRGAQRDLLADVKQLSRRLRAD
jgi:hypothetical protein